LFANIFPPDIGGGATRAFNIAMCLIQQGHNLQIVTSVPHYPSGLPILKALRLSEEKHGSWWILRLPTSGLPHKGFLRRVINYCWYSVFCLVCFTKVRYSDVVFCIGPHPFTDFPAYLFKKVKGAKMLVDISDLWPETVPIGSSLGNTLLQGVGYVLNRIVLRIFSDGLCIYNKRALKFIKSRYDYKKPAVIIENFADTNLFIYNKKAKTDKEILTKLMPTLQKSRFVVLYHGVIGPYQRIENVVKAAKIAQNIPQVLFVIVGDGERKERALKLMKEEGLTNIVFLPTMSRRLVSKIVAESDLGLVPIVSNNPLTIYVSMPIKATEFLASGTPILAPAGSYIGNIVSNAQAGFEVDFRNPSEIYQFIKWAVAHPLLFQKMRKRARQVSVNRFSYKHVCETLDSMIRLVTRCRRKGGDATFSRWQ
jgi:glycosyltransferase involved in cell wall biosynthesis